jgi:sec-independent protein translocase protein TatA
MLSISALAMWAPGGWELLVILIIALLLFGKRLPEVARNLGKGVVEFKKGIKGVEDDIDNPPTTSSNRLNGPDSSGRGSSGST